MGHASRDLSSAPPVVDTSRQTLVRLPGLFRLYEIEDVLVQGGEYLLVRAAPGADGTQLFAAYWCADRRG